MAIKSNVGIPLIEIAPTDTPVISPAAPIQRVCVTACILHNTDPMTRTVTLWESPDMTSASGKQIAVYSLTANQSADVIEVLGQGYAVGRNIIAQASGLGVNIVSTVTLYDAGS